MQRRIVAAVAAMGATAIVLAGCSNNPTSAEETVLTMFAASDFKAAVDPLIDDFEAANPGVKVNVTYAGGNDFETTEGTAIASGNGPDIIDALPGTTGPIATQQLIQDGQVVDLSDQGWASQVPSSVNSQNQPDLDDEGVYFYPVLVQPMGAFYSNSGLDDAGVKPPTTWSEVLDYCADVRAAGKIPFSLGIADQWITQLVPYSLVNTLLYGDDPTWGRNGALTDGTVTFPDSPWTETFQKYDEMRAAGCFSDDPNALNLDASLAEVATGEAVGIVQVGGLFGSLQSLDEDIEYTLAPLPATDDADQTFIPAAPAHEFAVNADSQNKELAIKFINFLAEPENVNKFVETIGGAVPAVPNDSFEPTPMLDTFNQLVADNRIRSFPYLPNAEVANALMVGTQNMFLGSTTPEQVVVDMQAAVK